MSINNIGALNPIISRVRIDITAAKRDGRMLWTSERLTDALVLIHLNGGVSRGVCPITEGESTTRLGMLDLDSHHGETSWEGMTAAAIEVMSALAGEGLKPIAFRSSGGRGIHIFILWDKTQDAYSVRQLLKSIIGELGYASGTKGVAAKQIEIFPKQDHVRMGGCGNQFILPLAGKSVPLDSASGLQPLPREAIQTLSWPVSAPVPVCNRPIPRERSAPTALEEADLSIFREMLSFIDPDTDREVWIKIGMALHYETGGSQEGLILWDEWSSGDLYVEGQKGVSNYEGLDDVEYNWNSFKSNAQQPVTRRTIEMHRRAAWLGRVTRQKGVLEMINYSQHRQQGVFRWLVPMITQMGLSLNG